jgi:two-component sensor histidine kinase
MTGRVMIVEDDGTIAVHLEMLLAQWGYEPLPAASAEEALSIAADMGPDLALMDIQLENSIDGITLAQALKTGYDVPVIYLTAYADDNLLHRASKTEPYGYLVKPLQDLTLRSTLQMALTKRAADKKLAEAIRAKEALMKEILHRTKNNLALITGFLELQSAYVEDTRLLNILQDAELRIQTIALIQEKLYRSQDLTSIDLGAYLKDLADMFIHFQGTAGAITLHTDFETLVVSTDTAIPCGLILNELLSNAIKHAFPEGQPGTITLTLTSIGNDAVELRVRDDGVGLPEDFDMLATESLGLQLVQMFVESLLQGTVTWQVDHGTQWKVRFSAANEQTAAD